MREQYGRIFHKNREIDSVDRHDVTSVIDVFRRNHGQELAISRMSVSDYNAKFGEFASGSGSSRIEQLARGRRHMAKKRLCWHRHDVIANVREVLRGPHDAITANVLDASR